jgi:hypothetical protein
MDELLLNAEQIDKLETSMRQVIRDECASLQQHVRIQLMTSLNAIFKDVEELKYKIGKLEYDIGALAGPNDEELGV